MSTEWISDGFWFHQHPTLKSLKLDEVCLDVAINDPEPLTRQLDGEGIHVWSGVATIKF